MRRQAINHSKSLFSCAFLLLFILQSAFSNSPLTVDNDFQSRYAVLIAELITSPKKEEYKKLQELGDVYYVIQTPGYKVYVGSYGSFDAAQPALQIIRNTYGYKTAKVESLPNGTLTNLLWQKNSLPDSYDTFTAKGTSTLPGQKDLDTEIRVYSYTNGAWATSNAAFKINMNKTGIHNETTKALLLDQNLTQRIYLDIYYKNHKVNPTDLKISASFGKETGKLVYSQKENFFEFNAGQLSSLPLQFAYQMTSDRYGIQTEVSIPLRWVNNTKENDVVSYYNYSPGINSYDYSIKDFAIKTKYTPKGNPMEYNIIPTSYGEEGDVIERIKKRDEVDQIPSGYYIQIAALGRRPDLQKFAELTVYNDVLYTYERSFYKVLVGGFATKSEAEDALKGIQRTYKKAYIIEVGTVRDDEVRDDFIPKGYAQRSQRIITDYDQTQEGYYAPRRQYIVKLAAYSDPDYFDDSEIKDLGTCWEIKKGRLTVKYITLSGLKTPYQANAALREIREAGFREAFLMTEDEKGRLVRVD